MRYIILFFITLPLVSWGQSQTDYNNFLKRFVNYYNERSINSLCSLFPLNKSEEGRCFWKTLERKSERSVYDEYGMIQNYEYLGVDTTDSEDVAVFKVQFANKGSKALSFNLKDQKFGIFRLNTSSDFIEEMLKKKK